MNVNSAMQQVNTDFANGKGDHEIGIDEQELTVEKLKYFLPKDSKVNVTQSTVDMVNKLINESGVQRALMEERLMTYTHLLGPGVGMKQLIKAIQFVTLSTTPGMTQTKAYLVTFPAKANELIEAGRDPSSFASQYAKTKIVQDIMQNTQIGMHITYAPLQHQLVEKLLQLSNGKAANGDSASPTVQLNATLGLLDVIKMPEENTINLKTGMDDASLAASQNLADQIEKMAAIQLKRLQGGESLTDIQKVGVIVDVPAIGE